MPDNIRITHCVYFSWYLPKKTLLRRSCNFNRMTIIKKREKYIPIPLKFSELLKEKSEKWNQGTIEFTVAHDLENETWSIAIVHPRDSFNKKIGYKIVTGRLRRMLDKIKPYKVIPRTIYQLTK